MTKVSRWTTFYLLCLQKKQRWRQSDDRGSGSTGALVPLMAL